VSVAAEVHRALLARGETISTAESMTAGLLGAALTQTAGASATYRGGVIVYATDLKSRLIGVDPELLAARGAVDPEVAAALARGVRERLSSTWGVGLTGVAGPDRQDGTAVGTVFIAVAGPDGTPHASAYRFDGDRAEIRSAAVDAALNCINDVVGERE